MSANRPPSVMFRAATATSGGTGAPAVTYCSIWTWIDPMRASISTFVSFSSGIDLVELEVGIKLYQVQQPNPALTLDDGRIVPFWRRMSCAILAGVPTLCSSSTV